MTLTDGLAVYGALIGTLGAATQAATLWRDRPRIQVGAGANTYIDRPPHAWIDVHNHGTRPTTLRSVGFSAGPASFKTSDGLSGKGTMDFPLTQDPLFLEPGETVRLNGTPPGPDYDYHVDHPMRPYAVDVRNRRIWGKAGRVVRWVVGPNPPLLGTDAPEFRRLFEPLDEPIVPEPVEPWWKIWKPREQRFGGAYRH